MSDASDFVIKNGVLRKYTGPGGDVEIPDGVTKIGKAAFYGCDRLTGVTIPQSVTSIGFSAFANCVALTRANIPRGVFSIEKSTFWDCGSLQCVFVPDGVTSIGDWAFSHCRKAHIELPDSVTHIGEDALCGCKSVTITLSDSLEIPASALDYLDCEIRCRRWTPAIAKLLKKKPRQQTNGGRLLVGPSEPAHSGFAWLCDTKERGRRGGADKAVSGLCRKKRFQTGPTRI